MGRGRGSATPRSRSTVFSRSAEPSAERRDDQGGVPDPARAQVVAHGIEDIGLGVAARSRRSCAPGRAPASKTAGRALRRRKERREGRDAAPGEARMPFRLVEVNRPAAPADRPAPRRASPASLLPRGVEVDDRRERTSRTSSACNRAARRAWADSRTASRAPHNRAAANAPCRYSVAPR